MPIKKAPKRRYYVTYAMLRRNRACNSQLELFARTFVTAGSIATYYNTTLRQRNKIVYVTEENVRKAEAAGLSFSWLFWRADEKYDTKIANAYWKSNARCQFDPALRARNITRLLKRYGYL